MSSLALPPACQSMLHILLQRHGLDFADYSRDSLLRRITLRMQRVGIGDYAAYAEYLAWAPDECDQLFSLILINHTAFFRDPQVWAALTTQLAARLGAQHGQQAPLRIWSAGCATGQEPYSLAMLLAELVGADQVAAQATIYATDVDAEALEQARQASYHPWYVRMVPPTLLARYFTPAGTRYVVREELRRAMVFERHNLLEDAPLPQIDVLLCRNVLIYFTPAAQQRVFQELRGALADDGLLVTGKTELLLPGQHGLRWVSRKHQIAARALDTGAFTPHWQAGDGAYT